MVVKKNPDRKKKQKNKKTKKHHIEPFIVAARISKTVPSENSTQPEKFKQQDNEERLNNWSGKAMSWQYVR